MVGQGRLTSVVAKTEVENGKVQQDVCSKINFCLKRNSKYTIAPDLPHMFLPFLDTEKLYQLIHDG